MCAYMWRSGINSGCQPEKCHPPPGYGVSFTGLELVAQLAGQCLLSPPPWVGTGIPCHHTQHLYVVSVDQTVVFMFVWHALCWLSPLPSPRCPFKAMPSSSSGEPTSPNNKATDTT